MLGLTQVLVVNDTPSKLNKNDQISYKKTHKYLHNKLCTQGFFTMGISLNGQTKNQNVEEHIEIWVLKKTMQIKRKKNH